MRAIHRRAALTVVAVAALSTAAGVHAATIPAEPLEIGHEPQFVLDRYVVDATWVIRPKGEPMRRVYHPPVKHEANPLITGGDPSHLWVQRGADGRLRIWYQVNIKGMGKKGVYRDAIAYAESADGMHWDQPALNLFADAAKYNLPANTVLHRTDAPQCEPCAPQILDLPEKDRRGFRYVMFYMMRGAPLNGLRLIGSNDGVHWDPASDTLIARLGSDTHNTVVYDPAGDQYFMYARSKHIYRGPGQDATDMLATGESRRGISRMTHKTLWDEWPVNPQTILMPDELDAQTNFNFYMAMPVQRSHGVYWGFLAPFLWNDVYGSELAWSRDALDFQRLVVRSPLITLGPEGAWDHGMIVASPAWVEMGDEWWVYYAGWNGSHDSKERTGAIGLAKFRKEGFISQHAPETGGVVCTRQIRWPGGDLLLNADAAKGELRVRVSDELRRPIKGFNYDDAPVSTADAVAQRWKWNGRSLDELKGRVIRLEFHMKNADLYAFRAAAL